MLEFLKAELAQTQEAITAFGGLIGSAAELDEFLACETSLQLSRLRLALAKVRQKGIVTAWGRGELQARPGASS